MNRMKWGTEKRFSPDTRPILGICYGLLRHAREIITYMDSPTIWLEEMKGAVYMKTLKEGTLSGALGENHTRC